MIAFAELDPLTMDKAAMTLAYTASGGAVAGGGAVIFGMTPNEFAGVAAGIGAIGGFLVGLVGIVISWWYKQQHLKIARANGRANVEQ